MTLNEVYVYLKMNGLPVTFHDDNTRIRLEGSVCASSNLVFRTAYRRSDSSLCVGCDDFVSLPEATHRDLDALIDSYLEHCDLDTVKRVRSARLRYAIDLHYRQTLSLREEDDPSPSYTPHTGTFPVPFPGHITRHKTGIFLRSQ